MIILSGVFHDKVGREPISIICDTRSLSTTIRGVAFAGSDFNSLSTPVENAQFDLCCGDLCSCEFRLQIPVRLWAPEGLRHSQLLAIIELGNPAPNGGLDRENVRLAMEQPEFSISSPGDSGWFEDEMLSFVAQLPPGFSLQTCVTCGLSDYSPYGHGFSGDLACFREVPEDYRAVTSKAGIFALWGRMTEFVQEFHWCDQFEDRPKGRGYRG
jgi:hypothetical protein